MARKISLAVLVVGFLVASSFVGAAAFTSASVARDTTATVATDDAAIIGLNAGTADGAELNDGELVVYPEDSGENGLNQNATFEYGDDSTASAAESSHGFNITNNDDAAHNLTLSYSQSAGDGTMTFGVAYDSSSGSGNVDTLVTVDSGTSQTITLQSGETAYVVVIVDTGTTDIGGTFSIDTA